MVRELSDRISSLKALCAKHDAKRLWAFGSAAAGTHFDAQSDIDFLVEFDRVQHPVRGFSDPFWMLLADLSDLFDRRVELVELRPFNDRRFATELLNTRVLIYEQDGERLAV